MRLVGSICLFGFLLDLSFFRGTLSYVRLGFSSTCDESGDSAAAAAGGGGGFLAVTGGSESSSFFLLDLSLSGAALSSVPSDISSG